MLWGNYDTLNAATRFVSTEVPINLGSFANALPLSQVLPSSFYLSSKPSWWGTPWGTPAWPVNGPDVAGGNVSGVGGHANNIPAALCYANSPIDTGDRKSTRLNSSHLGISYAVFCLKKKKQ